MTWEELEKRISELGFILIHAGSTEKRGAASDICHYHSIATEFATRTAEHIWNEACLAKRVMHSAFLRG
ncbi:hypothetical protein EU545_05265 [Candidatus Thorarchaeota archaeon]|nr:MAG: hypothetical protein EU545_05265 [Candidatus Thorarchaeota archaeon]